MILNHGYTVKVANKRLKQRKKISGLSNTSYKIYQITKIKKLIITKTSNNIFLEHFGFLTHHVDLSCNEFTGDLSKENVKILKAVEMTSNCLVPELFKKRSQ